MPAETIPEGYHTVTPCVIVPGIRQVLAFLQVVFDAKVGELYLRPDGAVRYVEVRIGDSILKMGDPMVEFAPSPSRLYVYVADADAVYARALEAGAASIREPSNQFYGDRNAMVQDPAGNVWWIATHREDVSPSELRRRAEAAQASGAMNRGE